MAVDLYSIAIVAVAVVAAGIVGIKTRISSSICEVGAGIVIANVLLESVSEHVVHHSKRSVLIVKKKN